MESYRQTLRIVFTSENAARRARPALARLYNDRRAAFSTRMDDTNAGALVVAEIMARHGQKGTFYLNRLDAWWEDNIGADGRPVAAEPGVEIPRCLLAGGHSIGGHTTSHDYLPALSKNAAFREIIGNRLELEVKTGGPVVSFTYPFVSYRTEMRAGIDQEDLEQMLQRAGFYQLAEHDYARRSRSDLQDGWFIACDGGEPDGTFTDTRLAQMPAEAEGALFLVTMHPWAKAWGGSEFPKLEDIYRKWSGREDLWYCNQNEYAAYLCQLRHAHMSAIVEGRVLRIDLTRPDPLDLGDWIPLTVKLNGVGAVEIESFNCPSAEVRPVALADVTAVDWCHDRDRGPGELFSRQPIRTIAPIPAEREWSYVRACTGKEPRSPCACAMLAIGS